MVKEFRIQWYAVLEDESVLEGRSLEKGKDQKMYEYRLKPSMIFIQSVFELSQDDQEND